MTISYNPRERAVEAARILNSFLLDLVAGTRILDIFESAAIAPMVTPNMGVALNRMAISDLTVTLAKWTEFYGRYAAILPNDVREACRQLSDRITANGIVDFRNTVVGHILDYVKRRPLTSQEVDERLNRITAGNRAEFFRWINNSGGNIFPLSVVAITEHVRDRLRVVYGLLDEEIL